MSGPGVSSADVPERSAGPQSAAGLVGRGAAGGLAGGLLAGLVGLLLAWPALDAAVALEAAAASAHAAAGVVTGDGNGVVVPRATQRVGGLVGLALVGLVLGVCLAVAQGRDPSRRRAAAARPTPAPVFRRLLHAGTAVVVAVVVVPQLCYPALPPGVDSGGGDYAAAVALGVGVVAVYLLARSSARERRVLAPVAEVGLAAAAVILALSGAALLPERTASASLPADLLWDYRVGALAVQVVLVLASAALVGVLLDLAERRARRAVAAGLG